ncbi:unnamed protein product [Adineta steineri]|uniref:Uncharacterized protein n=1 Tax=Adineta steineri TaxID=433720 RepID=A0A819SGC3_9BILA|nr:unnamed protein product [Adineta steineri]
MVWFQLDEILFDLGQRCLTIGTDQVCSHSSLFHCSRSLKCISKHRLVDGYIAIENGIKDCEHGDDEWPANRRDIRSNTVPFAIFCDGETDLLLMDTLNYTDETSCEWWPCNNPYFRCDNAWHCLNGVDELNCPNAKCPSNEHLCEYDTSHKPFCVPYLHLMEKRLRSETENYRLVYFANQTYTDLKDFFFGTKQNVLLHNIWFMIH